MDFIQIIFEYFLIGYNMMIKKKIGMFIYFLLNLKMVVKYIVE